MIENQSPGELASRHLLSVDALRGFDMFWIMGGDYILRSLPKIHDSALSQTLAAQMDHCDWAGFHFYDLIFPMFVFIVGVSLVFSVARMIERAGRPAAIKRIVIRSTILFLLGFFYMGGVANGFKNVYFAGVLHRIAIAYFFAALIFCFFGSSPSPAEDRAGLHPKGLATEGERRRTPFGLFIMIGLCLLLLLGYWALVTFVPVPGTGPPSLDGPGKNIAHYIDELYLPGQKFEGTLLSTMAAVANCLLGVFAGLLLKNATVPDQKKVYWLLSGGIASLAVGFAWAQEFPIIKLLWTSTYVLVACGYGAILLGVFLQFIDIWKLQKWTQPFVWMGMNAITIYIVANVVNFHRLAERFVGGDIKLFLGNYAALIQALVGTALGFWLVHFLYRRKIFLRL